MEQMVEQDLNPFFDLSLDMLCIAGLDGYFKRLNPAFEQLLGWTVNDMMMKPFFDFIHPDDISKTLAEMEHLRQGFPTIRFENRYRCQDGSYKWLSWRAQATSEGLIYALARDITERKEEEKREARNQALWNANPDLIVHFDQHGVFLEIIETPNMPLFTPVEEFLNKSLDAVLPEPMASQFKTNIKQTLQSQTMQTYEYQWAVADDDLRYCEMCMVVSGQNEVLAIIRDISDQKSLRELEKQNRAASERRARQVRLSTLVAQEAIAVDNLNDLYHRVVTQVKEQFGFYHVQLLRYDPQPQTLTLVSASGDIGQQMLTDGHQMALGDGLIGTAAAYGTSVLRTDVYGDSDWKSNVRLPETKGEIAVPIKLGTPDIEWQVTALETFIQTGLDGFIVAAIDVEALELVVKQALDQNIPVVSINEFGPTQTAFVGVTDYDNGFKVGQEAGRWAKTHLAATDTLQVAIFNYPSLAQTVEREKGMLDGIQDIYGPNFELVATALANDPVSAVPIARSWLETFSDLRVILGINDNGALAAYTAIKEVGKNKPEQMFVGGIDAIDEALAAIREEGAYQATVDHPPEVFGILTVRTLVAAIIKQPYQASVRIQSQLITFQNVEDYIAKKRAGLIPNEPELGPIRPSGIKIGLSVQTLNDPFFGAMADAALQEAERLGVDLVINDPKSILGVLDVQTNVAGILDVEDQLLLEGLCGQIAIAIKNTTLLEDARIFRRFADAASQGFSISTLANSMIYNNSAFARILELADEETSQQSILDHFPEELHLDLQEEVYPIVLQKGQWQGELPMLKADGKAFPTIQHIFMIRDEIGTPQYIANVFTDITEQKYNEAELKVRLNEVNALQNVMQREQWQAFLKDVDDNQRGYFFDQQDLALKALTANELNARSYGNRLSQAIVIGDELIGQIEIQGDGQDDLIDEDQTLMQTIADEIAGAMERARLIEQTQAALAQTEQLYKITAKLSAANSLEDALLAAASSSIEAGAHQATLFGLEVNERGIPEWMETIVVWRLTKTEISREKRRYDMSDSPVADILIENSDLPLIIADTQRDERIDRKARQTYQDLGLQAMVQMPLRIGQRWVGLIAFSWPAPRKFSIEEERFYQSLGNQAAIVIDNLLLLEQTQQRAAESDILYQTALRLNEAKDLSKIVTTMGEMLPLSAIDRVVMVIFDWLEDQEMDAATVVASWHSNEQYPATPVGTRYPKTVFQSLQVLISPDLLFSNDVLKDERVDERTKQLLQVQNIRAMVTLPLNLGLRQIGSLILESKEPYSFTEMDTRLYLSIAPQVAAAVANQRLLAEAQEAINALQAAQQRYTLQAWNTYLAKNTELFYEITQEIAESSQHEVVQSPPGLSEIKANAIVENGTPLNQSTQSDKDDSRDIDGRIQRDADLIVPLKILDQEIGVLGLQAKRDADGHSLERTWTDEEIAFVEAIGEQFAQTAESLRLLDETQRQAAHEQRVYEIAERIDMAQTLEEALQIAIEEVGQTLQAPQTRVQLEVR